MKKCHNCFFVVVVFLLVLSCFCGCGKEKTYNIFTEFAVIAEGSVLPRHANYGQHLDDVLSEKNLSATDVTGSSDRYVVTEYTAEHIPYKIREKLSFVSEEHEELKNQLYRVDYLIEVKEEDKEKAFEAFYEQAKAAMPAPDAHLNSLEDMKTGGGVIWTDKEGNTLSFSTSKGQEGVIFVDISMRGAAYQRKLN